MCYDVVHSIRSLYNLLSSYQDKGITEHRQTFKIKCFVKRIVPERRCTTRSFQSKGGFVELGYFDKDCIRNTSKNCTITQLRFEWKI